MTDETMELRRKALDTRAAANKAANDRRDGAVGWPEYDAAFKASAEASKAYYEALAKENLD